MDDLINGTWAFVEDAVREQSYAVCKDNEPERHIITFNL